jgi:hypothetical protein
MNLSYILSKLQVSRLINLSADKYELGHDSIAKVIANKRSAEEKSLIEWTLLIKNKLNASKKSAAADYLTSGQLAAIQPFESKFQLTEEEYSFLEESKAFQTALEKKKIRKNRILLSAMASVLAIITLLMFVSMYLKHQADLELARNTNILNQMYFYADRYALTVKKGQSGHFFYGFMDKEGKSLIKYEYSEANPFDEYGYARVKTEEKLYLIDTFNNRYPLAESPKTITENTLAVSLKEQWLDELPAQIFKNTDLKVLYLRGNKLKTLPSGFDKFEKLKVLDLGYNRFEKIPESVFQIKNLDQLDLQSNKIDSISVPENHSNSLKIINLSRNNLPELQSKITNLSNLVLLDVSNNQLKEIDEKLADLKKLKTLNLYGNLIKSIPEKLRNSDLEIIIEDKVIPKQKNTTSKSVAQNSAKGTKEPLTTKESILSESSEKSKDDKLNCATIKYSENNNNKTFLFETQKFTLAKVKNENYYFKIIVLNSGIWAQVSKDETALPIGKGKGFLVFLFENQGKQQYLKFSYADDENSVTGKTGLKKVAKMDKESLSTLVNGSKISVNFFNTSPAGYEGTSYDISDSDEFKNLLSCVLSEINTQNIRFNTPDLKEAKENNNQTAGIFDETARSYISSASCTDSKNKFIDLDTENEFKFGIDFEPKINLVKMTLLNSVNSISASSKIIFVNNEKEEKTFGIQKAPAYMTGASIMDVSEIFMEKKELNWFLKKDIAGFFIYNPVDGNRESVIFNKKVNLRKHIACFSKGLN